MEDVKKILDIITTHWIDGVCNKCNSLVIERASEGLGDYMNTCSNPECVEYGMHYCGDQDEPEYYKHGGTACPKFMRCPRGHDAPFWIDIENDEMVCSVCYERVRLHLDKLKAELSEHSGSS